jgi:hypothetical protein
VAETNEEDMSRPRARSVQTTRRSVPMVNELCLVFQRYSLEIQRIYINMYNVFVLSHNKSVNLT